MNQQKAKLFRKILTSDDQVRDRKEYRRFKEAYVRSSLQKREAVTKTAQKIISTGNIHRRSL